MRGLKGRKRGSGLTTDDTDGTDECKEKSVSRGAAEALRKRRGRILGQD